MTESHHTNPVDFMFKGKRGFYDQDPLLQDEPVSIYTADQDILISGGGNNRTFGAIDYKGAGFFFVDKNSIKSIEDERAKIKGRQSLFEVKIPALVDIPKFVILRDKPALNIMAVEIDNPQLGDISFAEQEQLISGVKLTEKDLLEDQEIMNRVRANKLALPMDITNKIDKIIADIDAQNNPFFNRKGQAIEAFSVLQPNEIIRPDKKQPSSQLRIRPSRLGLNQILETAETGVKLKQQSNANANLARAFFETNFK